MNRASSPTGWVRNPAMINPDLDPNLASSYELGYTWNPITGCLNHTPEGLCLGGMFPCYAYKLAHGRLKQRYLANHNMLPFENIEDEDGGNHWQFHDPFYPRFWEDRLEEMITRNEYLDGNIPIPTKKRGIFVCDMADPFGIGVPEEWTKRVLDTIDWNKYYDRFYLLTKQPQNLPKWSPFPDNCWVGVSATDTGMAYKAVNNLKRIEARAKYISFEPLLGKIINWVGDAEYLFKDLDWVIIGACTGTLEEIKPLAYRNQQLTPEPWGRKWTLQPKIEWVEEIVRAADRAGVKVFLKDNLMPLFKYPVPGLFKKKFPAGRLELRQEMAQSGNSRK